MTSGIGRADTNIAAAYSSLMSWFSDRHFLDYCSLVPTTFSGSHTPELRYSQDRISSEAPHDTCWSGRTTPRHHLHISTCEGNLDGVEKGHNLMFQLRLGDRGEGAEPTFSSSGECANVGNVLGLLDEAAATRNDVQ
jgi:hypothetical protein